MSVIKKPDLMIFAQDAKAGEIETFPDILRGWGVTLDRTAGKPPLEWFNSISKRTDEWLMYLTQHGISEWDATLSYPKTAIVQFNSIIYVSITETKGEQPDRSQASWSTLGFFLGLDKKIDKDKITNQEGESEELVVSQMLLTRKIKEMQPAGNYADGDFYTVNSKDILIKTPENKSSFELGSNGWLKCKDLTNNATTFSVNSNGVVGDCLVPIACGGTGAKTAQDSRVKLNLYSTDEIDSKLNGKQDSGNYANGMIYTASGNSVIIKTASSNGTLEIGDTGWLSLKNESSGKVLLSITSSGIVNDALVSISSGGTEGRTASEARDKLGITQLFFGLNQKWNNVTGSRVSNTIYTNTGVKSISISVTSISSSANSAIELLVDNSPIAAQSVNAANSSASLFSIIPPGSTYMVRVTGGYISNWQEFK